jgi:ATP-dependent helicase/nuclease subunit A
MSTVGHEMIFASAGSGKTFALTTRFIRLLALGVAPERIVALTFTRKAAGEFFGEILNRLAAASGDEAKARALAVAVERPELAAADFRRLLRGMIGAMHRLSLGTLDGFFARIVRAFPLELGLGGEPGLLDEHAAAEEMRRVLGRLFAARGGLTPEQKDLIEAFRLATLGKEEKNVAGQFDAFVREHLELWRAAPVPAKWGTAARIWPRGFPWRVADDAATARAAEELIAWAERTELSEKHRARLTAFARAALEWSPGAPWNSEIGYVAEKALADWRSFEAGSAELKLDRKAIALGPVATAAVATLVGRLVGLELGRRMAVTQGIAAVMRTFDALYDAEVRRAGRLTFADLQQLLSPERLAREAATADTGRENTGPGASDSEGDGDTGLETRATTEQGAAGGLAGAGLDYRIDARLDHWLFDEFQDTSYQQWKILERLVDEVVEDPEGRRSLFYVGDVKQAIFTWREGDPRLFAHVAERYRGAAGGGVVARELNDSWRSGPALIEMVNRVCGDEAAMAELFPEAAGEWKKYWREHRSARPENRGQAALLFADDADGRWATVLRLLREIRPTARGLTCAVLVRKNDVGVRLAEYLRREGGIAAVAESDLKIGTDNPAAAALAALLQAAAHPEDGFAWRQVAMSPLAALLAGVGCGRAGKETLGAGVLSQESGGGAHGHGSGDPCHGTGRLPPAAALCRGVLGAVETDGFEAWLEEWARRLEPALAADDAFTRLRLRQLVAAGRAFDETGSRDVDAFLRFLGEYTVREPEGAGVVRVLTVHKSKGLGFDVVILPDLEGRTLVQRREGPAVRKAADRSVAWVLQHPGATIAENDPVLREYQAEALAENCYEQLSLLYVALTRGKRGLYAVIERPGKTASRNYPKLLVETLGEKECEVRVGGATFAGSWSAGEPEWFAELGTAPARQGAESDTGVGAAETSLAELSAAVRRRAGLMARRPSGEKPKRVGGAVLFSSGGGAERTHGRRVHALLAAVEWADGTERERLAEFVRRQPEPEAWSAALREAEACLDAEELRTVFARAGAEDEVWRERAFEAVVGGAWVSGVPDRVVVRRERGTPRGATIYDFKTDRDADAGRLRQRYAEQLELYREVVAGLLGLAVARVECRLVATAERSLVGI